LEDAKSVGAVYGHDDISPNEWTSIDGGLSTIVISHLATNDEKGQKSHRLVAYSVTQKVGEKERKRKKKKERETMKQTYEVFCLFFCLVYYKFRFERYNRYKIGTRFCWNCLGSR